MMVKRLLLPVLGVVLVTFAGCASSKSPSAGVAAPADVTGAWTGSTARGASTITMVLKQSGTTVTGDLRGAGTLDGPIEGTVDGNTIRLKERSGFGQTPLLNVQGNQISGTLGGTTVNFRRVP